MLIVFSLSEEHQFSTKIVIIFYSVNPYHLGTGDVKSPSSVGLVTIHELRSNDISVWKIQCLASWTVHMYHCSNAVYG